MSVLEDVRTQGRARLTFADPRDVDEFVATLGRFERGDLSPDEWRAFRLVRGTYGQRQAGDVQMLRVKVPQGVLDGPQLRALADVAESYSRGFGHVTTRQNLQFHFVRMADVEPAMRRLGEAGLTTREACGNAVRNVTACPYAGVAADEAFDVTPYAEALTRHLLRHPLSSSLPRKFKIAFEGCAGDHVFSAMNDLGFRGRLRDGERGFRLSVGGGTSTLATSGGLLFEFLPAAEVLAVAEAVVRVFHRLGDRQHRQRNRLKFLIRELGFERFKAEFEDALAELQTSGAPRLAFDAQNPPEESSLAGARRLPPEPGEVARRVAGEELRGPGIVPRVEPLLGVTSAAEERWIASNVRPQKQPGYGLALVTVPLGDLSGAQLRVLADLAEAYADGSVRTTVDQDLLLRWVRLEDTRALYRRLAAAGLGRDGAGTLADVTSCPGAESCKLAVTQSRGLGRLLSEHLSDLPEVVAAVPGLDIKISGCPNGCGQHHVAGIGFQGSVRKLAERVVPQYFVMVGGGADGDTARFGRLAAKVPARRAPEAIERLVALYRTERAPGEAAPAFFRRVDLARVKSTLADLEALRPEDASPDDFIDLGEAEAFKVETQAGECAV